MSRNQRRGIILAAVILLLVVGRELRDQLGLELSPAGIEAWVDGLGWYGPVIFVVLLALRTFVVLPTAVILPAGGLVFGTLAGTLLGWLGIMLSAGLQFAIARGIVRGRRPVPSSLDERVGAFGKAGAVGVFLVTAHPLGPMSAAHVAAGISSMPLGTFVLAVLLGAPVRSFGYSYFGTSLADLGSIQFYTATVLLSLLIVVPLLHTNTRQRIFAFRSGGREKTASDAEN